MSLSYNGKLISLAKNLRKNMTRHEKHLWYDFLRSYSVRVQRQKVIGNYIVDFYCHCAKLVIEVDGSQHYINEDVDVERDLFLKSEGLEIIRISNRDIDENFKSVCEYIDSMIKKRI